MIKRVLVPTDFSPCSINALRYAVAFAKQLRVEELLILHTFVAPITHGEAWITLSTTKIARDQKEEIKRSFGMLKKVVPELREVNYSTIIQQALLVDALISISMTSNIDLIIMGTRGATGIDEIIFGTNTYMAIKESNLPVIAVPEKATYNRINIIALATDFKEVSPKTLEPVRSIGEILGSTISIVHIADNEDISFKKADEAKKFERHFKNVNRQYHYIKNKDVEDGLDEYLEEHNVDLLTLIPRKHPLWDKVFGGGESKSLIFHTKIPLLALPEIH